MAHLLDGVTVLDLTRMLAGPYGSMLLADLGAEVIKVEDPAGGDPVRAMGPPFVNGESAYFISINRNKKSLTLDLTTPRGREVFLRLVQRADVVLDNFRPGILEKLAWSIQRCARSTRESLSVPFRRSARMVRTGRCRPSI